MSILQVLSFLIFVFGGFFSGIYLVSNVDGFKYFTGCILGGIVGWTLWVITCSLFTPEMRNKKNVFFFLQEKAESLKAKSVGELEALPIDSEETITMEDISVHIQTQREKREDGKFQLTISAKFQDGNDIIAYTRMFIAPNQQEKQA